MDIGRERLVIDVGKCTACRLCEIACALKHHGRLDPRLTRVRILRFQDPVLNVPVICMACDDAPCIKVCPINARHRDTNRTVVTDDDRCIGCGACIYVCPVGSPGRNPFTGKTTTCDMCKGEASGPWCVAACRDEGALTVCKPDGPTYAKASHHAGRMVSGLRGTKESESRDTSCHRI